MDRISAFISYSAKQKVIGGRFKTYLEDYCGYETFIAHEDIQGASVWEDEIIKKIKKSDFFIPLISEEFKYSPFTDQETGIAICLQKKIIPVKLGNLNPYGFIKKFQALQYRKYPKYSYFKDNVNELALTIAQIGFSSKEKSTIHQKALNSIVYALCNSKSFNIANATIEIIIKCKDLLPIHISQIKSAIKMNSQINKAYGISSLQDYLNKNYGSSVDKFS